MKRALLLAAVLAGSATLSAQAQTAIPYTQSVNQTSPSILDFNGTGTAQFNSSKGTNNQFNVGSSTNLGVNASISATEGVTPTAAAALELGRGTALQQTIGTSSNAANAIAVQSAATSSAYQAANSSEYGSSYSAEWGAKWKAGEEAKGNTVGANWEAQAQGEWKSGWESRYNTAYDQASQKTSSAATSSTSDGKISGTFTTVESASGGSTEQASAWGVTASADASAKYGHDYENRGGEYSNYSESEWNAAYSAAYNSSFNQARANSGWQTKSDVVVTGLGSMSTVVASEDSSFKVNLEGDAKAPGGTATGNGSAGASLSSSSFATQNSASTASGFIQAFAGE